MSHHPHPLTLVSHNTGHLCDGNYSQSCRFSGRQIPPRTLTYHCPECDYDLCTNCYSAHYPSVQSHRSRKHPHGLVLVKSAAWECDNCKYGYHSTVKNHYRCNMCDYDECENCFQVTRIITTLPHPHTLVHTSVRAPNWECDGKFLPEKCISELSGKTKYQIQLGSRYRCDRCDYDLCIPCYNYYMSLYNEKKHPHVLTRVNCDSGWLCNGKYSHGGCKSNITTYNQSSGLPRYRCEACDFDLCELCYNTFQIPQLRGSLVNNNHQINNHNHNHNHNNNNDNNIRSSILHPVRNFPVQPVQPIQPVQPVQPQVVPINDGNSNPQLVAPEEECIVCMEAKRAITFVHASTKTGHTCCCVECAKSLTKCPICNLPFDMAITNFIN